MSQVMDLLALQGFDDEASALRAALADVETRLGGDPELDEARRQLLQSETARAGVQAVQRRLENEIERLSDRIAPEEKRLYDGSVKNAKELTNIQHEIELLKGSRAKLEDELVEVLDRFEAADRELSRTKALVGQLEERRARQQDELKHEATRLRDSIARADLKREAQKAAIEPRSVHAYEDLRRRKGGLAVVKIQGGICSGCRIATPDSVRRRALAGVSLAQCPNCERILYTG